MAINASKSHCMCIGPRCNNVCSNITTRNGTAINWTDSIRYLGVSVTKSTSLLPLNARMTVQKSRFIDNSMPYMARLVAWPLKTFLLI